MPTTPVKSPGKKNASASTPVKTPTRAEMVEEFRQLAEDMGLLRAELEEEETSEYESEEYLPTPEVPRKKKAKRKSVAATRKPKVGRFPPHFRRSYVKLYHPEAVEEVDDPCDRCAQDGFLCFVVPGRTRKLRCLTCTTGVCSFMPKAEDTAKPVVEGPTRPGRRVMPTVPSAPPPTDRSPSKDLVHRNSIITLIHSLKELAAAADETKDKKMVWTVLRNQAKGLIEGTGFSFADLGITAFEEDDVVEGEGGEEGGENDAVESVD